ncbi:tRNA glutamyl-Q(34) synthetase GluQRS [Stappia sp. ES.058]|uniref:tRNA glutamyl-Q(34) synthetase GluQRS n=1 Tax=Stappia sp. ES.058 TaxID=1881061 RepID=UPI00087A200C|nr:tRNA glutamyl-Q(34) synthetase GluQRS [Stappia sp. ES.058]SDU41442.1 glutamyl-Q tRNA(Asp) synthetase [Stappia sp. ES.058]
MTRPVYRFAPSPNGHLHLGHALSALMNFDAARASGGRFLLRIEDIDTTRCTPELEEAIHEDLAWLGLSWETPVRRQSAHFADYRAALETLEKQGLVYPGYLTRREIRDAVVVAEARDGRPWPRDPDGGPLYPGDAAVLSAGEISARKAVAAPHALRLDMKTAIARLAAPLTWQELDHPEASSKAGTIRADPAHWGDVVLARKDTPTSYHLSVVVDDAVQGVSHVVRGRDLYQATAVHRLLQMLLGLPEPRYHHHRLIEDGEGRKLSKSQDDTALSALREEGASPRDIRRRVGLAD